MSLHTKNTLEAVLDELKDMKKGYEYSDFLSYGDGVHDGLNKAVERVEDYVKAEVTTEVSSEFHDWFMTFDKPFRSEEYRNSKALAFLMRAGWGHALEDNDNNEIANWQRFVREASGLPYEEDAMLYLANAILNGYTVRKEELFYVKMPITGSNEEFLVQSQSGGTWFDGPLLYLDGRPTLQHEFTERQIEQIDPLYLQFKTKAN